MRRRYQRKMHWIMKPTKINLTQLENKENFMTTFMLLGYVAVIVISYKGAVIALAKSGLL